MEEFLDKREGTRKLYRTKKKAVGYFKVSFLYRMVGLYKANYLTSPDQVIPLIGLK